MTMGEQQRRMVRGQRTTTHQKLFGVHSHHGLRFLYVVVLAGWFFLQAKSFSTPVTEKGRTTNKATFSF